jgi:hypothetical protein
MMLLKVVQKNIKACADNGLFADPHMTVLETPVVLRFQGRDGRNIEEHLDMLVIELTFLTGRFSCAPRDAT